MEFADEGTADIANGRDTKKARKTLPSQLHQRAQDKLTVIAHAETINDLRVPPSNHLEQLRDGRHSIRINDQYRICFRWSKEGTSEVQIVDYHD